MLPESLAVTLAHCGEPMTDKGGRAEWEGDFEITTARFVCPTCELRVEVKAWEMSPR